MGGMYNMNHFICPYCGKQLDNQAMWIYGENQNANEFWCDDCGRVYIEEEDGSYFEEVI
jgi:predicted RNA-binding Zn-ribbon protein involved in translation (DUF1610 family)